MEILKVLTDLLDDIIFCSTSSQYTTSVTTNGCFNPEFFVLMSSNEIEPLFCSREFRLIYDVATEVLKYTVYLKFE